MPYQNDREYPVHAEFGSYTDETAWGAQVPIIIERGRIKACQLTDKPLLQASRRMRYNVYCLDRGFLPAEDYPDDYETDPYDLYAAQFGVFLDDVAPSQLIATARLVPGSKKLPLHRYCSVAAEHRRHLDGSKAAEVSRLCMQLPKTSGLSDRSALSVRKDILVALYKAMYVWVKDEGVTHLVAAMEPALARMAWRSGFPFAEIGPEADYYGRVFPYMLDIAHMEHHMRTQVPQVWQFFAHAATARALAMAAM